VHELTAFAIGNQSMAKRYEEGSETARVDLSRRAFIHALGASAGAFAGGAAEKS